MSTGRRTVPGLVWLLLALASCRSAPAATRYAPRTREFTITTVPLLSRELQSVYPFLKKDFARGGVLDGKEVYAFFPNVITAVEGDTLRFTLLNPEDDEHAFVLRDLLVKLPPLSRQEATYIVRRAGVFLFSCSVPAHLPMMRGQLVVLAPGAVSDTLPGGGTN